MTKPRIRVTTDGRIGWPDVVQYELMDGPDKGKRLTCRPLVETHLDPLSELKPSAGTYLMSGGAGGWAGRQRRGYPYRIVVHDRAAYERLRQTGEINDPRHTGAGRAVDNRSAPGG